MGAGSAVQVADQAADVSPGSASWCCMCRVELEVAEEAVTHASNDVTEQLLIRT